MSLKDKLEQAGKKAETQKAERRAKVVKGSHLTEQFLTLATEAGLTVTPSKSGAFNVITGAAGKARRIYVSTRGGTVDFSGFSIEAEGVTQISEDEAKKMHLGLVRGRIDFDAADEQILVAYALALVEANVAPAPKAEKVKEPKAPRAPRAPKAPKAEVQAQATA